MTLKFCFGNYKKDGRRNLKIRLKRNGIDKKIPIDGLYLFEKDWDAKSIRVKSSDSNFIEKNELIYKYYSKINFVKSKLELKSISTLEAIAILSSSSKINSMKEFVKLYCDNKSQEWIRNSNNAISAFENHTKLKEVTFNDITYENIEKLRLSIEKKGNQPDTYNHCLRHIKAIYNYAINKKITHREFIFEKGLFLKVNKSTKVIKNNSHDDIYRAIKNISVDFNNQKKFMSILRDFEAIGFWLLMFSLRGMYAKDIVGLSAEKLDYNYNYKIKYLQTLNEKPQEVRGNSDFYNHHRHKTKNYMKIWITLPPIGGLIYVLRRLIAFTHPKISYLSKEEVKLDYQKLIEKNDYDELKIFTNDLNEDYKTNTSLWNNLNKHLRKLELESFESARKTFNTIAQSLDISKSDREHLLGHTDNSSQSSYVNYSNPKVLFKVCSNHARILNEFDTIKLYDFWIIKLEELYKKDLKLIIGESSNLVYLERCRYLLSTIKGNTTEISQIDDLNYNVSKNIFFQN